MFKRILALIAVLSAGVLAFGLFHFPPMEIGATGKTKTVDVSGRTPELVCPGPVFVNGGDGGTKLGTFVQSGFVQIEGFDSKVGFTKSSPAQVSVQGGADGSKNFNALQVQAAAGTQAFGLTAASCVPGTNDAWIVAGDNSIGREALLVLVNTGTVDATVTLELLGSSGPIEGAGLSGISAPAGKTTVLPLASFAPKSETFAVHVTSRGASLGVYLQQKTVRGVTPGGLDLVGVTATAEKKLVIPGVFIRTSGKLSALAEANANFADTKPILRVTAPGTKDATFTAQVAGADGSSFGTVIQGTVPAGSTKDFEIADVTDGDYAVQFDSDQPIMASVRYSRAAGSVADFAWATGVSATKLDAGFTAPRGAVSKLALVNPSGEQVTVKLSGQQYVVKANSNVVVGLTAGKNYQINSTGSIAASIVIDKNFTIAVVPVIDYRSSGGTLKVNIR
ncbi:MAG: hypothetical protein RL140_24 [Actinomycetota bacterium]|jgi:6,7-dimethyl-8-ribityllumazine synthase